MRRNMAAFRKTSNLCIPHSLAIVPGGCKYSEIFTDVDRDVSLCVRVCVCGGGLCTVRL